MSSKLTNAEQYGRALGLNPDGMSKAADSTIWIERCDRTRIETVVLFLADHFGVKAPELGTRRNGGNSGHYWPRRRRITVAKGCQLWVVAHEFAHHLDHDVNPKAKGHTRSFFNNLNRIIAAMGETAGYPWDMEYKTLNRWASEAL